ncbi:MAG: cellulase family glycosylhydrolase [Planctomycetota bacterium]
MHLTRRLATLTACTITMFSATPSHGQLVTDGNRIVDREANPVTLRGTNLGNWFVLEMWMLGWGERVSDQHEFESILVERHGEQRANELMDLFRASWITAADFGRIRGAGMNCVRLPFEADLLDPNADDPDAPLNLTEESFEWIDHAIALANDADLYVILDLHGAPGRQSAMDHTGRREHNQLWEQPALQEKTRQIWSALATRYRDDETVVAYDLLNEPWGKDKPTLAAFMQTVYDAVREADPETIVVFPSWWDGVDFYPVPADAGWTNMMHTKHPYPGFFGWGEPEPGVHEDFLARVVPEWEELSERLDVPLLMGEFQVALRSAGGPDMMARHFQAYADAGFAATMWSYKVLTEEGGMEEGSWGFVTNRLPAPYIELRTASYEQTRDWIRQLATMPIEVNEELAERLREMKP